jgi:SagB-type dehydrogenase family enzyme
MTHRRFGRRPVTFEELSTLLSRTFGRAGWVDGGVLGKKLAKTSPSAGARHPIECYALVWNVEGVPPGIYHYGVKHDALERLERCDPRGAVVAFTSGQRWIARAGFACVLTAVAARTLWKYPASGAYRLLLLDAGHLAQTFLLLAAEAGLGGFVTAALQHDEIERRLRLDGLAELPLYICGAGASVSKGATLRLTG